MDRFGERNRLITAGSNAVVRPRCLDLVEQPGLDRFVNELSPQTRAVNARKNMGGEGKKEGKKEKRKETMVGAWRKNTFNGVGSLRSPLSGPLSARVCVRANDKMEKRRCERREKMAREDKNDSGITDREGIEERRRRK